MMCCCPAAQDSSAKIIVSMPSDRFPPEVLEQEAVPAEEASPEQAEPVAADAVDDLSFVAQLSRGELSRQWGLKVDFTDEKTAHVCRVTEEGDNVVKHYNASVSDSKKIKVGDFFMVINGVSHESVQPPQKVSDALIEQLRTSTTLEVNVRRPQLLECKVQKKSDQTLGLNLNYTKSAIIVSTVISAISTPEVKPGDHIMRVGDLDAPPERLLEAIHSIADTVPLLISRPAP